MTPLAADLAIVERYTARGLPARIALRLMAAKRRTQAEYETLLAATTNERKRLLLCYEAGAIYRGRVNHVLRGITKRARVRN